MPMFESPIRLGYEGPAFWGGPQKAGPLALQCQHARPVRQEAVVHAVGAGVAPLVEELQIARVNGLGLVWVGADQIAVADVFGPGGAAVGLAGEGVALGVGLRCPRAAE